MLYEVITMPAITVSIGVSCWGADETSIEAALLRADNGLYRAKQSGRNCVRLSDCREMLPSESYATNGGDVG